MTTKLSIGEAMSAAHHSSEYEVIWLVRRLFRSLAYKSNEMLEELEITAADRAVMEFLYPDKKLSVPEIASRYHVSPASMYRSLSTRWSNGVCS